MSRQVGLIKFTGKMDGISFYETKRGHFARIARGPSKERIMTDPRYERTRENISEFSGMAIAVKLFRSMLQPVSKITDGDLRLRLSKIFRSIIKQTAGIRGQRSVAVSRNHDMLRNVELNASLSFALNCPARFTATHSETRMRAIITVEPFLPVEMIAAGVSVSHFRLVQLLGSMPDVIYRTENQRYESADNFFNGRQEVTFSDYIPVSSNMPVTVTLESEMAGPPPGPNVTFIQGLGIIFYEQIGMNYYPMNRNDGMQIVDVF